MYALIPRLPAAGSDAAKTSAMSAVLPLVMNCLVPLSTQPSAVRVARVCSAEASEPPCGSVRQKAQSSSPRAIGRRYFSFCAGVPYSRRGMHPTELCPLITVEMAPSPAATSSSASA
jgi:hypothetical protein